MYGLVKQHVDAYLREQALPAVASDRVVTFDVTNRKIDGTCYLFFAEGGEAPLLVAKAARTPAGRAVFEIEHETLATLAAHGMNEGRARVPSALGCWREGEILITLQSALGGTLLKNVPGARLFSPEAIDRSVGAVLDWWRTLQQKVGTRELLLTGEAFDEYVARPVRLFRKRYLLDADEHEFLDRWCGSNALRDARLPLMVDHGDFCAANMVLAGDEVAVFDWEFPLDHQLPFFDLFFFFSSVRFPYGGRQGESSHFDSFKRVFWEESYFRSAMTATLAGLCERFGVERRLLGDLLVLSTLRIANMKYEGLLVSHGLSDLEGETIGEAPKRERWRSFDGPDKDAPFARMQDGVFHNLRELVRRGVPEL
jgi:hypothetical protein